jgi:hypothetical protein
MASGMPPSYQSATEMPIATTDLPPYPVHEVLARPYPERMRLAARSWAAQVQPNSRAILALYWLKYLLVFVGGWAFFCSRNAGYPGFSSIGEWAFSAEAFHKAIAWAMFYELLGLGCAMGPMNGRFWPPLGGFLHFLRPGTTKLALFPKLPLLGGITRSWLDVGLYAALQIGLMRALLAPAATPELLLPIALLLPLLGIADKTIFLCARAEHYWVALVCLVAAPEDGLWLSACKLVWSCIWFWAATSKLNHHFPSVIMVMMNNGPLFPSWLKRRLFVSYPDDLRPSALAQFMAHMGTATEFTLPLVLLSSGDPLLTTAALVVMTGFHGFVALNNPAGMPIEWNILMIYGGWFLFGDHPEASVLAVASLPLLAGFLLIWLVAIPLYGNLVPSRVSFLLAMRYYAGNWAYNIWLFRDDAAGKLSRLVKASAPMREQLERMVPDVEVVEGAMLLSSVNRLLHLQGKVLYDALPRAVDQIDRYQWMDGELVAGLALGWNFGDGHLNDLQLLNAIQAQCGFEAGELRVVMVESQPLFGRTMAWRIADAKTGVFETGETEIAPLRACQPWPEGEHARAFLRGRPE